jgi:hypothetical protein
MPELEILLSDRELGRLQRKADRLGVTVEEAAKREYLRGMQEAKDSMPTRGNYVRRLFSNLRAKQ